MQTTTLSYNVHGLFGMQFVFRRRNYGRYVDNEYSTMRVETLPDDLPVLRFHLNVPLPSDKGRPDIRLRGRFLSLFRYEADVYGAMERETWIAYRGDASIMFYRNIQGILLQAQVIEPLVTLKALTQNAMLVHSACVADNGLAAVMPAQGGTGKTTNALTLVNEGMSLLGDDLVFVTPAGQVYSYLRPVHVFAYVLDGMPFLQVPWPVRAAIRTKNVLRHVLTALTGVQFALATRVHVQKLMPNARCIPQARLGPFILLGKEGDLCRSFDANDAAQLSEFIKLLRPTMELSENLRTGLLKDSPDLLQWVAEAESKLLTQLLRRASGCYAVNCRHPGNAGGAEIRRILREADGGAS